MNDPADGIWCTIHFKNPNLVVYSDHGGIEEEVVLEKEGLASLTIDVLASFISTQDETACPRELLELLGTHLYELLFPLPRAKPLRDRFETLCNGGASRFCVQLEFGPAAWELAQLPWEFLYVPAHKFFVAAAPENSPLILTRHVPNQRSLNGATEKVNVLLAISDPESDRASIHIEKLIELFDRLKSISEQKFTYTVARNLEWGELRQKVEDVRPTVFHFLGHGERGALWFVRAAEKVAEARKKRSAFSKDVLDAGVLTNAEAVQQMFPKHKPDLVILEACEGDYDTDVLPGVAQLLVEVVPAVVAMRYKISAEASRQFVGVLYEKISEGVCLDDAVRDARRGLASLRVSEVGQTYNDRAFGTPVLYLKGSAAVCRPLRKRGDATSQTNITQPRHEVRRCPRCERAAWSEHGICEHCGLPFDCPQCHGTLGTPELANYCNRCQPIFRIVKPPWPVPEAPLERPPDPPPVDLFGRRRVG